MSAHTTTLPNHAYSSPKLGSSSQSSDRRHLSNPFLLSILRSIDKPPRQRRPPLLRRPPRRPNSALIRLMILSIRPPRFLIATTRNATNTIHSPIQPPSVLLKDARNRPRGPPSGMRHDKHQSHNEPSDEGEVVTRLPHRDGAHGKDAANLMLAHESEQQHVEIIVY